MTPVRRSRRPSDGMPPRMRTQRELQNETETLKATMFSLNLKLELLKKQNHDLKDQMDEANRRIEELEPMEDENLDLREDNDRLLLRMQDMEEDIIKLRDQNTQLRDENIEIIQIQTDAVAELDKQLGAVEEAADMIFKLEDEKTLLKKEVSELKEQMDKDRKAASDVEYRHLGIDGQGTGKCPSRVCSIDESRPSTSHFDSDYYSQPSSPQTTDGKASKESLPYSEPAKKFLEINMTVKRSVQDLKKRVSDVSMRRPKTPVPEVPRIPDTYKGTHAQQAIKRTSRRQCPLPALPPSINTALRSPIKAHNVTIPRTPTVQPSEGLRGIFRDNKALQTKSRHSRRLSADCRASLGSKGSHGSYHSHHSEVEQSSTINPPPRHSSRNARTSSSIEQMLNGIPSKKEASEWAGTPSSPPVDDLTNEPERRDQWWKNMNSLPNQTPLGRQSSVRALLPRASPNKAPRGMENERDFFFNGNENEDQFMKRAHGLAPKRREK
jgi:myosin heavy subunit